jgi:hypothetical protein
MPSCASDYEVADVQALSAPEASNNTPRENSTPATSRPLPTLRVLCTWREVRSTNAKCG